MDSSIRSTILRTIEVIWRRRFLLSIPFLIMLPASVGCAMFLGGGYSARSLVMLQEKVASNPLAHDANEPSADRMAQMLKGLRALLASDYVIAPIVDEAGGKSLDVVARASRIRDLRKNVSVDLLGNDFLEFRLAGSWPNGLGETLQKIMTNLFGALVSPPGETAGTFASKSLRENSVAIERASAAIDARMLDLLPAGLAAAEALVESLTQERNDLGGKLTLLKLAIGEATTASGVLGKTRMSSAVSLTYMLASQTANQSHFNALGQQIEAANRNIESFKRMREEKESLAAVKADIDAKLKENQARYNEDVSANWSAMINAPERMIVVDPPMDPKLRSSPRAYFVASGAFGGLLLGIALVILAEIFDTTLRSPNQMAAIAGVPCLGLLPALVATRGGNRQHPFGVAYAGTVRLPRQTVQLAHRWTNGDV